MFFMVVICVGIFHCYQKFCSKIACCCCCCPNLNSRTVSRWSKVRSSKDNGKTIKEILDSLEMTSVTREKALPTSTENALWHTSGPFIGGVIDATSADSGNGFPSVPSNSSLDVVIQPPESFQTVPVVKSPAPVSPVAVCQLHLPSNGGIANLPAAATLPNGPIEVVSRRVYTKSANSNTCSSSAKQVGKPSTHKPQVSCIVHQHYPTPLNGRSLVGPYSARVYPSCRPSGRAHGLLQHSDAISQDSTSNSAYFSAHPENVILNVPSDELDDLEADSDCAVPELEELFYAAHPKKPPCRLHNPTMPTTSTLPTRSISAQTALDYQAYPRNFINSH